MLAAAPKVYGDHIAGEFGRIQQAKREAVLDALDALRVEVEGLGWNIHPSDGSLCLPVVRIEEVIVAAIDHLLVGGPADG